MPLELATLLYHEVTDDPAASGFQRAAALPFKLRRVVFGEQLAAIALAGRTPVRVDEIDFALPARRLLLTFDDGGASALHVGELLARRGWRAHFFITTGKLGTRTFLDGGGVRALHAAGHLIGTHSHSHPNVFRALPAVAMVTEWRQSRDRLEQLIGAPVLAASVPGGDSSPAVERSAAAAGLRWLFTSEPQLRPRAAERVSVIGRACIKTTTTLEEVCALASFRGWRRQWLRFVVKDKARTLFDPAYRSWVRAREVESG